MHKWHEARLRQVKQRLTLSARYTLHMVCRAKTQGCRRPIISNGAFRWGTTEFAGAYQDPQFLVGIKPSCAIGIMSFSSKEIVDIEEKYRNRSQGRRRSVVSLETWRS
jgi:hypothetical protein